MLVENGERRYEVGKRVADADAYRLYLCVLQDTGRQCLLQVAATLEQNGGLDRAAYILKELEQRSQDVEAEYEKVKTNPKHFLNYQLGFPELVDTFIAAEQGGRRINILGFRGVADVQKLVPLSGITEKDGLRIDLKTSAWIMGKTLKMLAFAHSERVAIGDAGGSNILLEPNEHYVVLFDWSKAKTFPGVVPWETAEEEISQAAGAVITALGGDPEMGVFPDDGEDGFEPYIHHLLELARGKERSAERAHKRFYEFVNGLWERKFHPFASYPL